MILTIALLVALAAAIVLLLVLPKFQELGRVNDEIEVANQEIDSAEVLLGKRMAAKDNAARTSADLLLLGNRMPESPELPALIISLQDLADASGVRLLRVAPAAAAVEGGQGYGAFEVELALQGRWADYVDFLRRLQSTPRGLRVVQMVVLEHVPESAAGEGPEAPVIPDTLTEIAMTVRAYTYVPSAGATATPAPPAAP